MGVSSERPGLGFRDQGMGSKRGLSGLHRDGMHDADGFDK